MKKILFVEDEPILIKTYRLAFEQAGYEVKIIEKLGLALKTAQQEKPDLIIMEIAFCDEKNNKISKEQGINAIASLKAGKETKNIPIIVLTHLSLEDREQVLSLGAQDYITKLEIMPNQIIKRIERK
ncbi:MAG: response regulator [bacterium]